MNHSRVNFQVGLQDNSPVGLKRFVEAHINTVAYSEIPVKVRLIEQTHEAQLLYYTQETKISPKVGTDIYWENNTLLFRCGTCT